ncbi:l-ascorbate oxidase-like protein [Hordeum vulgare]|nr:l-ascorbate oxidase-like protein [Hordeum vulgare]
MPDLPPVTPPLPSSGHTEDTSLEFIARMRGPPRSSLHLPCPFAMEMEVDKSQGMYLRMHGCCNGVVHAGVEYPMPRVMFLRRGWKTFVCAHNFMEGYVLHFKLLEADVQSINIYGHSGARLGCCEEISSDTESSSSTGSDEEDSVDDDGDSEPLAVKSEYDGLGSS